MIGGVLGHIEGSILAYEVRITQATVDIFLDLTAAVGVYTEAGALDRLRLAS